MGVDRIAPRRWSWRRPASTVRVGLYAANEALIIDAIRHKLAESPPLAVDAD